MRSISAGGRTYDLEFTRGEVVGAGKRATTSVHGGGGGSAGGPVSVSISSTTTTHDDIYVRDRDGREHAFQLSNFDVACREGHDVTVVWALRRGKKSGPYLAVVNHSTSQVYFHRNNQVLVTMFRRLPEKAFGYLWIGAVVVQLVYFKKFEMGMLLLPLVFIGIPYLALSSADKFLAKRGAQQLRQNLKSPDWIAGQAA